LRELGGEPPEDQLDVRARWRLRVARWLGMESAIRRQEAAEDRDIGIYERQRQRYSEQVGDILTEVQEDERQHRRFLKVLSEQGGPQAALDAILRRERWHRGAHTWVGDAIYGANDGLGAVFGLVAGVAGYTETSHWILVSGLAGTVASALSMAAIAAQAAIGTALAYWLYFRILKTAGATNLLLVTLLMPPAALLLGALFAAERFDWSAFAGLGLIVGGLAAMDGRPAAYLRRRATPGSVAAD